MNKYKVEVCTDSVIVVEAHSESGAEEKAIRLTRPILGCCGGIQSSSVTKMTNLSDPVQLVADLTRNLQWFAFKKRAVCKFCGGLPDRHAEDCVLERARYFLNESK